MGLIYAVYRPSQTARQFMRLAAIDDVFQQISACKFNKRALLSSFSEIQHGRCSPNPACSSSAPDLYYTPAG